MVRPRLSITVCVDWVVHLVCLRVKRDQIGLFRWSEEVKMLLDVVLARSSNGDWLQEDVKQVC